MEFSQRILYTLSGGGILILSYLVFFMLFYVPGTGPGRGQILHVLFLLLNIPLLSAWLTWGKVGGLIVFGIAGLLTMFAGAILTDAAYNFHLLNYCFISVFFWYFFTSMRGKEYQLKMKIEDTEENHNSLLVEYGKAKETVEALEKKSYRYHALKDVTQAFSSTLSLEEVVRLGVEKVWEVVGKSGTALLFLIDEEKQELGLSAIKGERSLPVKSKKGDVFDRAVLKQRQPLIVQNIKKDFRFGLEDEMEEQRDFLSLIIAPIVSKRRLVGLLRLDNPEPQTFSQDDLRVLDIISNLLAVAIENARLYRRTEELAIRDGLTGLYVHRYFQERFTEEIQRAVLGGSSLSILMLDIDNFKDYNDRYGHQAGDMVLQGVARVLKEAIGLGDLVARYGGEEFAVVLTHTSKEEALKTAEDVRGRIASEPFRFRTQEHRVTVSIGVSTFPEDARVKEVLIRKADAALYKAKGGGRNRVCAA